jgi:glycosyltransferase involved in cell wall biosynthesis
MDAVEWPVRELPYQVLVLDTADLFAPPAAELARLRELIGRSRLVAGYGFRCEALAREAGVPYIMVLEYDLATQIAMATGGRIRGLRDVYRALWCFRRYWLEEVPAMRRAQSLHCNGYPVYEATRRVNARRLLYLDSRLQAEQVIPEADLTRRLAGRRGRALRVLYSGRFERVKGALEAVEAALRAARSGAPLEFVAYGQGSLCDDMRSVTDLAPAGSSIAVRDAIPFPDLVRVARTFDVALACNTQHDPSCTYVESMGSGLPVLGYANRMLRRLVEHSGGGAVVTIGDVSALAAAISGLANDAGRLESWSWRAREFGAAHTADVAMRARVQALNDELLKSRPS